MTVPAELKPPRKRKAVRGKPIDAAAWYQWEMAIAEGKSKAEACRLSGISRETMQRMLRDPDRMPEYMRAKRAFAKEHPPDPKGGTGLSPEAQRALEDFAYFRLRYFGLYSTPWQVHAAETIVRLLATEDKEYAVINAPPGTGKSWLFTLHVTTWLIVRNRSIRILIGSASERVAQDYSDYIKNMLERTDPILNKQTDVDAGRMAHAEATLVGDFGRFKPMDRGTEWTKRQFRVEQADKSTATTKEKTVSTYGRDGTFLGGRFDFVIWDDLVTEKILSTPESREKTKTWWDNHAENRIDDGGVTVLQGQRLHPDDLYRYCLDKPGFIDEDDEETELSEDDVAALPKLYHHVVYKAHYQEHCRGRHKRTDPPYDPAHPDTSGCLLDPRRLSWKEIGRRMASRTEPFDVVYQQEDVAPDDVLVPKLWINGGPDENGVEYPGCWDHDRSVWELPRNLKGPLHCVVTADPSPSKFWAVECWVWQPSSEMRYLIDLKRDKMQAPDFLDYNVNTGQYTGLLETWWHQAVKLGVPIKHVVIEENAAQTFIKQYNFFQTWATLRGVKIVPHETYRNKADKKLGVQTIAPHYEFGRIRLPGNHRDISRGRSMALVSEVTKYPMSQTDDCVMAHWFFEYTLQRFLKKQLTMVQRVLRMPPATFPGSRAG